MDNSNDEVIDLTDSFTLVNHCALSNAVIELLDTDESFIKSPAAKKKKIKVPRKSLKKDKIEVPATNHESKKLGDCPICFDPLGKKPLASTKCGHVFCMVCIKLCMRSDMKCPTCRCRLKGSNAFHPLYF